MKLYEFPYQCVPQGSRIIIYGAGTVGQSYLHQILLTKYCSVVCFIDKNPTIYQSLPVEVSKINCITYKDFDYVVIANSSLEIADEIIRSLTTKYNVKQSKIIYDIKYIEPVRVVKCNEEELYNKYIDRFAFLQDERCPIAIHLEGGFGDYIVRKNNIKEISEWDESVLVDIYVGDGKKEFANVLFSDIKNINLIIEEDALYYATKDKYLASFRFSAFLIVDNFNESKMKGCSHGLKERLYKIKALYQDYGFYDTGILLAIHYARCQKDGLNCYTAYNRYGAFKVNKHQTAIPLIINYKSEFDDLKLINYITVNYGWDRKLKKRPAKVWPFEYLTDFVLLVQKQYPKVSIVQIGLKDSPLIRGCTHVIGKNIEIIKYVLMNSNLHIDCEGGLVHLATQLGTKCAVMFGPTPIDYYGYKENINIVDESCSNCYWYVPDCTSCYRGLDKPKCMYNLTPEKVFRAIKCELDKL